MYGLIVRVAVLYICFWAPGLLADSVVYDGALGGAVAAGHKLGDLERTSLGYSPIGPTILGTLYRAADSREALNSTESGPEEGVSTNVASLIDSSFNGAISYPRSTFVSTDTASGDVAGDSLPADAMTISLGGTTVRLRETFDAAGTGFLGSIEDVRPPTGGTAVASGSRSRPVFLVENAGRTILHGAVIGLVLAVMFISFAYWRLRFIINPPRHHARVHSTSGGTSATAERRGVGAERTVVTKRRRYRRRSSSHS